MFFLYSISVMGRLFSCRLKLRGIHYLGPKPQLPGQVVMTNLLGEFDGKVSVGPVVGNTFIHDLIDDVQHIVLQGGRGKSDRIEQTSWRGEISHPVIHRSRANISLLLTLSQQSLANIAPSFPKGCSLSNN